MHLCYNNVMDIIDRKTAKAKGLVRYFTGRPCKHGHIAERQTSNGVCCECAKSISKAYSAKNREKVRERQRQYEYKNQERIKYRKRQNRIKNRAYYVEYDRQYCLKNKEKIKERRSKYYQANREKFRKRYAEYYARNKNYLAECRRRWGKENPHKGRLYSAKRKAALDFRTPDWVNVTDFDFFYELARSLTESSGIKHEVDHIVPLRGENVCGLHVPWNLQVITKRENLRKGNRAQYEISCWVFHLPL